MKSLNALEELGRVQLSRNFFMRDFLYSEISNFHAIPNLPDDPELAIEAGSQLATELLEPIRDQFGHVSIRSAYRSPVVNAFGNENGIRCGSNQRNAGHHIWDQRDSKGHMGATACIVVPAFVDRRRGEGDWQKLAWWIHDHLPYSSMYFYPKLWAFNLRWCEVPERWIKSYTPPKGILTKPGMANHEGNHEQYYRDIL